MASRSINRTDHMTHFLRLSSTVLSIGLISSEMSSEPRDTFAEEERERGNVNNVMDHMTSCDSQAGTGALALRDNGFFSLSLLFFLNSLERLVLWSHDNKRSHMTIEKHTWVHNRVLVMVLWWSCAHTMYRYLVTSNEPINS